jgi:hypothetical protein
VLSEVVSNPRIGRSRAFRDVIGFDGIGPVLLTGVASRGQQLVEHSRVGRRAIGAHLGAAWPD